MKEDKYYIDPPLIWIGAKRWLRESIWKLYYKASKERDKNLRYVDPFCGGLSAPLYIMPERAWLSDSNKYLINFYNCVIKNGAIGSGHIDSFLSLTPEIQKIYYYNLRDVYNKKIAKNEIDDELAEIFYFLNKTGYGGLNRYNSKGEFNVPYRGNISNPKTDFSLEQSVFRDWEFTSLDFMEVLDKVKEDDFLFVDPPYDEVFNKYIQAGFSWNQQIVLAEKLAELSNPVVATNSATDRIVELYTGLGFDVQFRMRGNFIQRPKVKNGNYRDFKEVVFTKNLTID